MRIEKVIGRDRPPRRRPRDHLMRADHSSYFGGRPEVHLRHEVRQVLYCDFLSMYPTVCTLMGLWQFVIAWGMTHEEATSDSGSSDNFGSPNAFRLEQPKVDNAAAQAQARLPSKMARAIA